MPRRLKDTALMAEFEDIEICPDEPIYTSGVVTKLIGIPIWVLKQLDNHGVVSPKRETSLSSRLYSKNELNKLNYIWKLMNKRGVKVDGIKVILEMRIDLS